MFYEYKQEALEVEKIGGRVENFTNYRIFSKVIDQNSKIFKN